ncbi:MAG: NAD-dependent DNA ligase LigA [Clostridiales bacterium]|nr:NAD-dependent DNA ligase LigA [Clostridiales bacterium]MDD7034860.1 NAD-dependent DNA ligase LigA [Bacillota bacterium]
MRERIEELVRKLNEASREYYQFDREIMSNVEYDALYDELEKLEKETGIVLASSPTVKVGYQVVSSLPKENHPSPMLSLDKTKSRDELRDWLGDKEGVLSWKLDGLTVVLTYEEGRLIKALTRGDGITGEVITPNAFAFDNLPVEIPEKGRVVLRGEAVIGYEDFERINEKGEYKNPRNLCSGSVRQLNSEITAQRHVRFFAFALADGGGEFIRRSEQLEWLAEQGFAVVEHVQVTGGNLTEALEGFEKKIENFDLPSDGLVLIYDDIAYGRSLGATAKFPRDGIAFKWQDEIKETVLREVVWNASRTGLINPVAVFEPVELEGTTVTRASVHNLSIVEELALGEGDTIRVYKANMIIPQIESNLTRSGTVAPPEKCPVCGGDTEIRQERGVKTLHCTNEECPARRIEAFAHFVSRDALNVEGLSKATLEKLIDGGIIREFADIFTLDRHRERIEEFYGFGEKSFDNLLAAAAKASRTTPARLLYGLGIPGIGAANGKLIARTCRNSWEKIENITFDELTAVDGIGDVMARAFRSYFDDENNRAMVSRLLDVIDLDESFEDRSGGMLEGKTFVITGSLKHFENRSALKAEIEKAGGKTSGSVSGRTDYLINNDSSSGSSKNRKAAELGVPVITEEEFLEMIK